MAERAGGWTRGAAAVLATALTAFLGTAVVSLPGTPSPLQREVEAAVERSGASHPVTAVLLDFRGYDTWLELAVLLVAVAALLALRQGHDLRDLPPEPEPDPVLASLGRLTVPVMALTAGYLLWRGSHAPGGAFQAGAVLGAAGVLLLLCGAPSVAALSAPRLRIGALAGFLTFLVAGGAAAFAGRDFLDHPPAHAGTVLVAIEAAAAVSIGITLAALFAGARGGEVGRGEGG